MTAPVIGIDGLIGISYDLERIPVSLTCEMKPFLDFWGKNIIYSTPFDFALKVDVKSFLSSYLGNTLSYLTS